MHPRHMRACLQLQPSAIRALEKAFWLPRRGSLFFRLVEAGIDHATAVVTLLHMGEREGAETLLGHPIQICPPCLTKRYWSLRIKSRTADEALFFSRVGPNPHPLALRSAERGVTAHDRYAKLKPGMSVDQALRRGVTRRDLREWSARGAIKIERVK